MNPETGSVEMKVARFENLPEYITGKARVKWMSISVWRSMVKDVILCLLYTGRMDVQCSLQKFRFECQDKNTLQDDVRVATFQPR